MRRTILLLLAAGLMLPRVANAGLVFYADPGSGPYCVLFDDTDNTKADFTEGSGSKVGRFTVSDADLVTASLDAGTYTARIFANTAGSLVVASDVQAGSIGFFEWSGTVDLSTRASQLSLTAVDDLVDDLETRLTTARAGYFDKLNITGNVAGATDLTLVKTTTDKLDTGLELDGAVYRGTANFLETAPSAGSVVLTAQDIEDIGNAAAAAIDEDLFAAATWTYAAGDRTLSGSHGLALQTTLLDVPTNAELTTALGTADDAVLAATALMPTNAQLSVALGTADDVTIAAIAALNNLSSAQLASAIAAGDDATLAAVAALNNLSSAQAQTAAAAALTAYDPPTHTELTDELATTVDPLPTAAELATALGDVVTDVLEGTALAGFFTNQPAAGVTLDAGQMATLTADLIAGGVGQTPVAADVVDESRTWIANGRRANNIVDLNDVSGDVTLSMQPKLNPGTVITTVSAVSITGAATVTADTFTVNRSRTRAHFNATFTVTGTYSVEVTVVTIDGQTIKTTGTLKVN